MTRITASALARVLRCPASAVLPHDHDTSSPIAARGTALHAAAEGDMESVPDEYRVEAGDLAELELPEGTRHEVAFSYDVLARHGRELDVRERRYDAASLGPYDVAGTTDLWAPGYVGDLKSGFIDVAPAHENPQLLIAAAANAAAFDVDEVVVEIIDIRDPARPRRKCEVVDTFDLEVFRARLESLLLDVAAVRQLHARGLQLDVTVGDHCRYCPAMMACPEMTTKISRTVDGSLSQEVEMAWAGSLTPASAPLAYRQFQAVTLIVKRMRDILYAYGAEHDIDLGDGKIFGSRTRPGKERLDGDVAWRVLKEAHGADVAEAAVTFATSKKRIRDALRPLAGKGKLAAVEREVHQAIRDAGGSERRETTSIGEHQK